MVYDPRDETAAAVRAPVTSVQGEVLDGEVLAGLVELGDADFLAELVDDFLSSTGPYMEVLGAALESGDAETVRKTAHTMKSSSASMGATRFSELCREIEACGAEGDLETARARYSELLPHFAVVAVALADAVAGTG